MTIFVSIAAYRDPQLIPTIRDCLAKARYPSALRFGICWQHGPEERTLPFAEDRRFRVLNVDWRESAGPCWARAETMKLWEGEQYYLQLDSHHRFSQEWDAKLLHQAHRAGSTKPILSTYGAPFVPGEHECSGAEPMQMSFDRFTDDAIALFRPGPITNWSKLDRPLRARFVSAHFLFTLGDFVGEVPYDPELYFHGEEITLAVRAFTRGYDLFHPSDHIIWHEYTRGNRIKHWDDHVKVRGIAFEWHERDATSRAKINRFLLSPSIGPFACGTVRAFDDYEAYAGISFRHRRIQDYTRLGGEPPNPPEQADWAERIRTQHVRVAFSRSMLPTAALTDPHFWYVGLHDRENNEIYRRDISAGGLHEILSAAGAEIVINCKFESCREPATFTVWPVSHSEGWLSKLMGQIEEDIRRPV